MNGRNVPSKIAHYIDMSSKWVGYVLAPFILVLIGVTIYDIICRNIGIMTLWPFDVAWFIWAALLTLSMVYAVRIGSHVS
ncbi:unnamed protein product, partial [marine sediment metagenome]